jgi:hypothetical protein
MSRVFACAAASLAMAVTVTAVADDDLATRLATCQAVTVENDRLACYDELAASIESNAGPEAAPLILSDDIAKGEIKSTKVEQPEYAAVVTRCEEAKQERRLYFFMENGQVWKQSNTGRPRLKDKDCQFEVTITKDSFGWIMNIPSEGRKVRVKRIR